MLLLPSWLLRESALTREPEVAVVNPDDEPGHCNLTQTRSVMIVRERPVILGAG